MRNTCNEYKYYLIQFSFLNKTQILSYNNLLSNIQINWSIWAINYEKFNFIWSAVKIDFARSRFCLSEVGKENILYKCMWIQIRYISYPWLDVPFQSRLLCSKKHIVAKDVIGLQIGNGFDYMYTEWVCTIHVLGCGVLIFWMYLKTVFIL